MSFETISVVGLGYIGLPTAAMFASRNKKVIGVDVNRRAIEIINRGEIHIVEPDLDSIVYSAVAKGFLRAVETPEAADAFLIAVPTPFKETLRGGVPEPDLTYIENASVAISKVLKKGDLVILESTSPVGTTEKMAEWLAAERPDLSFPQAAGEFADINIAHCPERVLPGHVVRELVENDRVIGGMSNRCSIRAIELYRIFVEGECIVTDSKTAEMAKLTENSCRDVQIAFANELSLVCDELGINVWELVKLANRHPRINILQPGPGVGGHCIAVDPWFIVSKTPEITPLIHTARKVNDSKPLWVIEKVKIAIAEYLQLQPQKMINSITIACYGLAFKPDIDDLRESPALEIVREIGRMHLGKVLAIEPNVDCLDLRMDNVELVQLSDALEIADIHVVLVDHKEFKMGQKASDFVIDTKGIW